MYVDRDNRGLFHIMNLTLEQVECISYALESTYNKTFLFTHSTEEKAMLCLKNNIDEIKKNKEMQGGTESKELHPEE